MVLLTALNIALGLVLLLNRNMNTAHPKATGLTFEIPAGDAPIDFARYLTVSELLGE
jgi:hypothetical protein